MCKKIIAVFKTHFDIGFTALYEEILKKYSTTMLRDVLTVCNETSSNGAGRRFVWTMPSWPLLKTLENASKEDRKAAEKLIQNDQLLCHALPYTLHTETAGVADLIFGMRYAKEFAEKYGKHRAISAKMTDVPGHTWFLVSLLAKSGVRFLHLGCNSASKPVNVPMLFWWEAPDGERILTFYSKGGYGSATLPPEDWKFPVWLALKLTNDNVGPQGADVVEALEREIGGRAELQIGTMDDFYRELSRCDLSGLPVVRADLADSWIHGAATYPKELGMLRRARNTLITAQKMGAYLRMQGESEPPVRRDLTREAYENSLLFSEHTWGLSVIATLGHERKYEKAEFEKQRKEERYRRIEASWDEQRMRAENTRRCAEQLYGSVARDLARRGAEGELYLFNPSGQPFTGWVRNEEPVQGGVAEKTIGGERYVYAKDIPAFSFSRILPAEPGGNIVLSETEEALELSDGKLRLALDRKTGLISLCVNGYPVIKEGGRYEYNIIGAESTCQYIRDYLYRFYDWAIQDFSRSSYPEIEDQTFGCECVSVGAENNCLKAVFRPERKSVEKFGNAHEISFTYSILNGAVRVRAEMKKKERSPYIESGDIVFGFSETPEYFANKTGTVVDIAHEIVTDGNKTHFCMENYLEARLRNQTIRIAAVDTPLFSIGRDCCYRWNRSVPSSARAYFNLFNNMWGTNFPQYNAGDYVFEYYLIPEGVPVSPFVQPPKVLCGTGKTAKDSGIAVRNAELYLAESRGEGIVLLVRETEGKEQIARIEGASGEAFETDYLEEELSPIPMCNGVYSVPLRPYEIKKVLIK